MNNLLESAADNIFITSANVLDTLTYRFSSTATDVTIPNNNDSLTAPLTEQLVKDFDTFNQVLNDYGMDLSNCVYILNSIKTKNQKEKVIKAKREQQRLEEERLRLIKEKEDLEKKDRLAKESAQKQFVQNVNGENNIPQVNSTGPNGNDNNIDLFNMGTTPNSAVNSGSNNVGSNNAVGNDGDDMMLDLDLDNFNFDGTGADVMNFDFNDPMSLGGTGKEVAHAGVKEEIGNSRPSNNTQLNNSNHMSANMGANAATNTNTNTNTGMSSNPHSNANSNTGNSNVNANSGANEYLNFGQDSDLADLNLDFLQDDEMGNLMQNMAEDGGGSGNSKNDSEMNDDALAADQMEQLFSQFDEMVGNGI